MAKDESKFSEAEAQRRYEQALKGAFKTPPQAMKDVPPSARAQSRVKGEHSDGSEVSPELRATMRANSSAIADLTKKASG
jgi:hypothetical protein